MEQAEVPKFIELNERKDELKHMRGPIAAEKLEKEKDSEEAESESDKSIFQLYN